MAGGLVCVAAAILLSGNARVALLMIALSIGVTGLVFAAMGSRLGRFSGLDRGLRATGVPGTGTITPLGETGITVNGDPVIEFGLDIDTATRAPYSITIRQRASRLLLGTLSPGTVVAVRVDPVAREHLAIDWDAGTVVASAPTPSANTGPTMGNVRDAEHLLHPGRHATAVITSMEDAGAMSELGLVEMGVPGDDDRLFVIGLEVKEAGVAPYEVRVAHRIPETLLGRVGPRTRVDVAVDRNDDSAVAIDWDSVRR